MVDKSPVVADQQEGPLEADHELFEQLDGFQLEIVGGLVQHQYTGRLGEELGQQEPVAFAPGQDAHWRADPIGGKRKPFR